MNRSRLRWRFAILALAGLAACGETTAPAGEPTTVTVRAYVDANGDGSYNAGDPAVAGATITLENTAGGTSQNATTDAQGVATFASVAPGSYRATIGGSTPAGAVLATATSPVLVAKYEGGTVQSEFRFVFNPGEIAGQIFRDNNSNSVFDAGDTPAPGILVSLYSGTTAAGDVVATTFTAANGTFVFRGLRPGTYTYVVSPFPTMTIVGGATQTVTVGAATATPVPIRFTGSLLSSITDIRTQPAGAIVAFEGIATVGVGIFSTSTTSNQFNVQDASGAGILILQVPLASGIVAGDSVRVVGTTAVSAGEFLITGNPTITKLASSRPLPAPRTLSAAAVAASTATDPYQGSLVRVGNVTVTAVSGTATSTAYNVTVSAAGSTFVVRVSTAAVGIPQTYWQIGRSYDVIGLLGNFNGAQVKLRSPADASLRSNALPIGMLRAMAFADSAGTRFDTVTVEGVVHTAQGTFRTDNAYIQDATGGILLFNVPAGAGLAVGDSVRVTAVIDWFARELELVRFSATSPPVIEDLGMGATPQPRTISGAQWQSRAFEGQLVRLANARVDSIGNPSGTGGVTIWVITSDGVRVQVRIENNSIGLPVASWTVGSNVNIVGPLAHFHGNPQLKPRGAADVTAGTAGIITIAEAEQRAAGDTVTVEGVVTAPVGPFGTANAYIDDGTAGIQIFGVPADAALVVGDLIRVRGITGAFSGERQIARFSATSLLQITKIGTAAQPAPRAVTGAQVVARTFEGELVRLHNAVVVSVGTVSGAGGYNVTMRAADGTEFIYRNDRTAVGIPVGFFTVGAAYDVTGILSAFNSAPQLKARSPSDAVAR